MEAAMQTDLERLRERINQINEQLVQLVNERAAVSLEIGRVKAESGAEVYDPARERAILDQIDQLNRGPLDKGAMEEIFATIITACREIQLRKQ